MPPQLMLIAAQQRLADLQRAADHHRLVHTATTATSSRAVPCTPPRHPRASLAPVPAPRPVWLNALVARRDHLLGRYLSLYGLTFTGSVALGSAIGGLLLQTSPDAVWLGGALAAALAGALLLRLGDRIPDPLDQAPSRLASAPEAA